MQRGEAMDCGQFMKIEARIRKKWLISLCVRSAVLVCINLSLFALAREVSAFAPSFLNHLLIALAGLLFFFWFDYHCAFKKRGTARLAWLLVTIPFAQFLGLASSLWIPELSLEWNLFDWAVFASLFSLELYYWLNCYRLRRVNLKRREVDFSSLLEQSAEFSESVSRIESSQTLKSLREAFASTVKRWPQWKKQLARLYSEKKARLPDSSAV